MTTRELKKLNNYQEFKTDEESTTFTKEEQFKLSNDGRIVPQGLTVAKKNHN